MATFSALNVLACEDTRVTRKLLDRYGIKVELLAYHEHNAERVRPALLARMLEGQAVGLVSDAGTPCLADPGFKLVRAVHEADLAVVSVPGASSITAALSIAGLPTDRHYFEGFLPARQGQRRERLTRLRDMDATAVFLESPNRLLATLEEILEAWGEREAAVCREMTKLHEEVVSGPLSQVREALAVRPAIKGEIVLLVGRAEGQVALSEADIDSALLEALSDMPPGKAAAAVARMLDLPRDRLYRRAIELRLPGPR